MLQISSIPEWNLLPGQKRLGIKSEKKRARGIFTEIANYKLQAAEARDYAGGAPWDDV